MQSIARTLRQSTGVQNCDSRAWGALWCREKAESSSQFDWKEELNKGYFDDFGQMKHHKGKLFASEGKLLSTENSKTFPTTQFMDADSRTVQFPEQEKNNRTCIACVWLREGAKEMIQSWMGPLKDTLQSSDIVRIGIVEHKLMAMWPFRSMIVSSGKGNDHFRHLFHFGDCRALCTALDITNKLTAYIFLVDRDNLIRWRACGMPTTEELESLKRFYTDLSR